MTWFRVDDGWHSHPKVLELSLAARGLWVSAGSWCSMHLTDGNLSLAAVRQLGGTAKLVDELVRVGLWVIVEDGYQFHEWDVRNPTRKQVEEKREKTRNKVSTWRSNQVGNQVTDHGSNHSGNPAPIPSHPFPDLQEVKPPAPAVVLSPLPPKQISPAKPKQVSTPRARVSADDADIRAAVWRAYAVAYRRRYRDVEPTRNARVNSQIAQFCARVPAEDACGIVGAYVQSSNARYVAAGHSIGCLLQDAEKLRTEYLAGAQMTASRARKLDHDQDREGRLAAARASLVGGGHVDPIEELRRTALEAQNG